MPQNHICLGIDECISKHVYTRLNQIGGRVEASGSHTIPYVTNLRHYLARNIPGQPSRGEIPAVVDALHEMVD